MEIKRYQFHPIHILLLLQIVIYITYWAGSVYYGSRGIFWILVLVWHACCLAEFFLLYLADRKSFLVAIPLAVYAGAMGWILLMIFMYSGLISYVDQVYFPPFWYLSLFPLFSFLLNSCLPFLVNNLLLPFFLGGLGGLISHAIASLLGAISFNSPYSYPFIFCLWGIYLTLLILLDRSLIQVREFYTSSQELEKKVTLIFDAKCPICNHEMQHLQKRKRTGNISYACPLSEPEMKDLGLSISYDQSMKKIHAIYEDGSIESGTKALSALYARTNLTTIAIFLQAPGISAICRWGYAIWAKYRPKKKL